MIQSTLSNSSALRRIAAVLALAGAATLAAACQPTTIDHQRALPQSVTLDAETLPDDFRLAAAAAVQRLRGDTRPLPGVQFSDGAGPVLSESGFAYDGFTLSGLVVAAYNPRSFRASGGGTVQGREASAILLFADSGGRRAAARMLAHYAPTPGGIVIEHLSTTPLSSVKPRVEAYVVPAERLPDAMVGQVVASHASLFDFAVSQAVTPAEAATLGQQSYDIYLFAMDRGSDTARVSGRISDSRAGNAGYEGATDILDYQGWQVAIIQGDYAPNSAQPLYAKMVVSPGRELPFLLRWDRLAGLFGLTAGAR